MQREAFVQIEQIPGIPPFSESIGEVLNPSYGGQHEGNKRIFVSIMPGNQTHLGHTIEIEKTDDELIIARYPKVRQGSHIIVEQRAIDTKHADFWVAMGNVWLDAARELMKTIDLAILVYPFGSIGFGTASFVLQGDRFSNNELQQHTSDVDCVAVVEDMQKLQEVADCLHNPGQNKLIRNFHTEARERIFSVRDQHEINPNRGPTMFDLFVATREPQDPVLLYRHRQD